MNASPRDLRVAHHHPGRLRLRSPAFMGGADGVLDRATHAIQCLPGIRGVAGDARTGGVLVTYDPEQIGPDALVDAAARAADLAVGEPRHRPGDEDLVIDAIIDAARGLNAFVKEITGHRVDLRSLVPAALASAGFYSFIVGKEPRLPRWDTLVYWAYSVFSIVNHREIDERTGQRTP